MARPPLHGKTSASLALVSSALVYISLNTQHPFSRLQIQIVILISLPTQELVIL